MKPSSCPDLSGRVLSVSDPIFPILIGAALKLNMMTAKRLLWMASAAPMCLLLTQPLAAETLRGALVKAYQTNPTLTGARAGQRATDESVPLQKAAGRPFASAGADYTENVVLPNNAFNAADRTFGADVTLSVPIYSGGAVRNGIKAAEYRVESGRAFLRGTEASVFSQTVAAYMDVIRDSAVVSLTMANVGVLDVNLQATRDRFEVGDLTRTDIAQSESRLALARSDLETAQANLIASRESYIRLVGTVPDALEPPPPLPNLPSSPDMAVDVALANNPDILAAQKQRDAARYDVKVARAEALPTVSAFSRGNYADNLGSVPGNLVAQTSTQASVGVSRDHPTVSGRSSRSAGAAGAGPRVAGDRTGHRDGTQCHRTGSRVLCQLAGGPSGGRIQPKGH